ncbi:MAG: hypothetical protein AAGF92_14650 [Myxococcota bacterium]
MPDDLDDWYKEKAEADHAYQSEWRSGFTSRISVLATGLSALAIAAYAMLSQHEDAWFPWFALMAVGAGFGLLFEVSYSRWYDRPDLADEWQKRAPGNVEQAESAYTQRLMEANRQNLEVNAERQELWDCAVVAAAIALLLLAVSVVEVKMMRLQQDPDQPTPTVPEPRPAPAPTPSPPAPPVPVPPAPLPDRAPPRPDVGPKPPNPNFEPPPNRPDKRIDNDD